MAAATPTRFDAENHLTQASGTPSGTWTYVYDGNGLRVEKTNGTNGTLYWRDLSGNTIAETDLTGSTTDSAYREYIFFAGGRVAQRDATTPTPNVYFYYTDQIGSIGTITKANGTPCYQATFTPYGQEMATQTACASNYKFTGYERDSETGLDYAFARYYNQRLGRFMSADPLAGNITDPQSLNRYAYVTNSPTNFIDPSGMNCIAEDDGTIADDLQGSPCSTIGYDPETVFVNATYVTFDVEFTPIDTGSYSGGGGQSSPPKPANKGTPNPITCSTVLPDGSTVGSHVNAVSNQITTQQIQLSRPRHPMDPLRSQIFRDRSPLRRKSIREQTSEDVRRFWRKLPTAWRRRKLCVLCRFSKHRRPPFGG